MREGCAETGAKPLGPLKAPPISEDGCTTNQPELHVICTFLTKSNAYNKKRSLSAINVKILITSFAINSCTVTIQYSTPNSNAAPILHAARSDRLRSEHLQISCHRGAPLIPHDARSQESLIYDRRRKRLVGAFPDPSPPRPAPGLMLIMPDVGCFLSGRACDTAISYILHGCFHYEMTAVTAGAETCSMPSL